MQELIEAIIATAHANGWAVDEITHPAPDGVILGLVRGAEQVSAAIHYTE